VIAAAANVDNSFNFYFIVNRIWGGEGEGEEGGFFLFSEDGRWGGVKSNVDEIVYMYIYTYIYIYICVCGVCVCVREWKYIIEEYS
jgi:hypothetical protein